MKDKLTTKIGLPPGTIVFTGTKRIETTTITITDFDEEQYSVVEADSIEKCVRPENSSITRWIHVKGVHDVEIVENIARNFDIHPLIIEDISSIKQRPKVEIIQDSVCCTEEFRII